MAALLRRMTTMLKAMGGYALRVPMARKVVLAAGAVRGHALVLVFHRIGDGEAARQGLIPDVPQPLFRRQLEALLDMGDIVPLEALLDTSSNYHLHRPRFALTFDDDWPTHCRRALPVLLELGVTATFFLSGRSLHGLGPLWFETLDHLIATHGAAAAGQVLEIETADPERLALDCENDPQLQERLEGLSEGSIQHLSGADIRALADAGMTIGFHTLQHSLLPRLPDSALDEVLARGRRELEDVAGYKLRLFAYPHGKSDPRVAKRLPEAGFLAACTGRPLPVRPGQDPYAIGRWEPGARTLDRFIGGVVAKLHGWGIRA